MIDAKDLYTYQIVEKLTNSDHTVIGTTIISYEIRRYIDVRNLLDSFAYQIFCTQRIIIPCSSTYTPTLNTNAYLDYPAIVTNNISFKSPSKKQVQWIVDYNPRTINTSVSLTNSQGSQDDSSTTWQQSSGSTTSQSNTYGSSANLGFWGSDITGGISSNSSNTTGNSASTSVTNGTQTGISSVSSAGDSFTVKEWAAYTFTDPTDASINWVWGQEYPWNVLLYRFDNGGDTIVLPSFVQELMQDGSSGQLLPPSSLSQFGVDFSMKVGWLVQPTPEATVHFEHEINYYTASHQLVASTISASINTTPTTCSVKTAALNLCLYGLDPITASGNTQNAIIGFIPQQFLVAPVPAPAAGQAPTPFKIISINNNLLIEDSTQYSSSVDEGAGFTPSETALNATFTQNCTTLSMTVNFKVINTTSNYFLYMKHWMVGTVGVVVTIVVNNNIDNPIVKLVSAQEAEGGENNLLTLSLRNLDFGSVDYHDYLQLGLNTLDITLTPNTSDYQDCGYQIRALSIETM